MLVHKAKPLSGGKPFIIPNFTLNNSSFSGTGNDDTFTFNVEQYKKINIESFNASYGTLKFYDENDNVLSIVASSDFDISNVEVLKIKWSYGSNGSTNNVTCTITNMVFS